VPLHNQAQRGISSEEHVGLLETLAGQADRRAQGVSGTSRTRAPVAQKMLELLAELVGNGLQDRRGPRIVEVS
jgi:hypothetical protein